MKSNPSHPLQDKQECKCRCHCVEGYHVHICKYQNTKGCEHCQPPSSVQEWEKDWDKKVNELRNADFKSEKPVDFGYRYTNAVSDEIYSATDWGHIKSFISNLLLKQKEQYRKEIEKYFKGLILIPNPQLTKEKLLKILK